MNEVASVGSLRAGGTLTQGALHGFVAWTIYGATECAFGALLPWILHPKTHTPPHPGFTALLLIVYPAVGVLVGVLAALLSQLVGQRVRDEVHVHLRVYVLVSLIAVFSVNFLWNWSLESPVVRLSLAVSLAIASMLALSALSARWAARLGFLTNPWTVCLLLLGPPWLALELAAAHTRAVVAVGVLIYGAAVVVASGAVAGILRAAGVVGARSGARVPRLAYVIFVATVSCVLSGGSFLLRQQPLVAERPPAAARPGLPHILLITMDTVRADHLSLHGYGRDTASNLERLAAEASVYTGAVATGDMTLSTHASIFTGLYPTAHGAYYDAAHPAGRPLPESLQTLAEILADEGYSTAGIVANNGFLSDAFRLNQGFHYYDSRAPVRFLSARDDFNIRQGLRNILARFFPGESDLLTRRAETINAEVLPILETAARTGRPHFIFVNYMDAHWPYIPPPPFDERYPGKDDSLTLERYFEIVEGVLKGEREITERERDHLVSQYDGAIAYIDDQIGVLIRRLKELGIYRDTVILVTSDHGEVFGARGLMEHGVSVYQDQVHVPLIIKYPGDHRQATVEEPVSVADILPTVLELLSGETSRNLQGRSLLDGVSRDDRAVIAESFPRPTLLRWNPRFRRVERAVYWGSYKLVASTAGKRELYDLSVDPHEQRDIADARQDLVASLAARLDGLLEALDTPRDTPAQLDRETLERLKSLGYVE